MKYLKYLTFVFTTTMAVSCSNRGFDDSKYAETIEHIQSYCVTDSDYSQIIALHDDLLTYFEKKYTKAQLIEVSNHLMHEDEILGADDYELYKLLCKCSKSLYGLDLGAETERWNISQTRRNNIGL